MMPKRLKRVKFKRKSRKKIPRNLKRKSRPPKIPMLQRNHSPLSSSTSRNADLKSRKTKTRTVNYRIVML